VAVDTAVVVVAAVEIAEEVAAGLVAAAVGTAAVVEIPVGNVSTRFSNTKATSPEVAFFLAGAALVGRGTPVPLMSALY
jgi:hypothetical protein